LDKSAHFFVQIVKCLVESAPAKNFF